MEKTDAARQPGSPWRFLIYRAPGTIGFGGSIDLASYMQRDLVDKNRWISNEDYLEGLALAQIATGSSSGTLIRFVREIKSKSQTSATFSGCSSQRLKP